MRIKRGILIIGVLPLLAAVIPGKMQTKTTEEAAKPIIRMDLLREKEKVHADAARNIFSQHSVISGSGESLSQGRRDGDPALKKEEQEESAAEEGLDLQYIGFVHSDKKVVGLVICEGEPLAVKEGEMIAEDYKVGKIAVDQIEIIGPDSESKLYFFEGDEI